MVCEGGDADDSGFGYEPDRRKLQSIRSQLLDLLFQAANLITQPGGLLVLLVFDGGPQTVAETNQLVLLLAQFRGMLGDLANMPRN